MFRRHYNLALMGIWLAIAVCLLAPGWVLPERAGRQVADQGGGLVGVLAAVFAVYNLARWWAYQSLYRARAARRAVPLAPREPDPDDAPTPDFDFSAGTRDAPPPP